MVRSFGHQAQRPIHAPHPRVDETCLASSPVVLQAGKYLTFQLSRQYFETRSDCVLHIVPASHIRVISGGPPHLCGSVDANARLIAVVHVREHLGLSRGRSAHRRAWALSA